jgi:transcriptional regulator with XRE-family HTH domain
MSDAQPLEHVDVNQLVADNVRAELSRQRWSGRQAAVALGVTNTYINRRTSGTTPMAPSDLAMFASLLSVPVSRFFEHTQKAPTRRGEGLLLPELDSNQQPAG